jgi:long-chain acyl-CoA synthetase
MSFEAVEALGDKHAPGLFEHHVAQGQSSDIAIFCSTSGTTGKPKLAMLTHANMLSMGRYLMEVDPLAPGDEFVSFLPLAWIGEQMITLACAMQAAFTTNFPEATDTCRADTQEIGPHAMFAPPRIWEDMVSNVQVKIEDTGRIKRWFYNRAMAIGNSVAEKRFKKHPPSFWDRLTLGLADWIMFAPIKDQLGLRRSKRAYTGGAALGPDVFRFFHALGVNLKQIYGQTEIFGVAVLHRDGDVKFQTVGLPLPGTEIKIADNGEVLLKSAAVFKGYYRNEKATAEALTDGWLHTGDAGYLDDDNHLVVIDRAKDVMTLSDNTKFSPQFIENKLKFSPYVREAVVFGGDWPFVAAMLNIDMKNVGKWAEKRQISYTTYTDLAQKPEVYKLIRQTVESACAYLPTAARIARFLLLHKELDADDAELTRTRKVRRNVVGQRYSELLQALYSEQDSVEIDTTITYQDGRTAQLRTCIRVEQVFPVTAIAREKVT